MAIHRMIGITRTNIVSQVGVYYHVPRQTPLVGKGVQISLERLNEIHNQKDEDQNSEALLHELPTCHDIHLDHIRFSYSGAERDYALDDVSLTIPQGKVTAVLVFNKLDRCSLHKPPKLSSRLLLLKQ
jgi:ABC-type multidrug transport system fused ATPase/permease subunit